MTDTVATTVIGASIKNVTGSNIAVRVMRMIDGIGTTMVDGTDTITTITQICITSCGTVIVTRIAGTSGIGKLTTWIRSG